jgi:hypothetical protein
MIMPSNEFSIGLYPTLMDAALLRLKEVLKGRHLIAQGIVLRNK